jgi:hypothetical protein
MRLGYNLTFVHGEVGRVIQLAWTGTQDRVAQLASFWRLDTASPLAGLRMRLCMTRVFHSSMVSLLFYGCNT